MWSQSIGTRVRIVHGVFRGTEATVVVSAFDTVTLRWADGFATRVNVRDTVTIGPA